MQSNNKKKICIVASSLGKGGAEKSSATLSKMLFANGYDVHIVTVLNNIGYDFSGKLFNLGILKDEKDSFLGRLNRLIRFKKYLNQQKFDCIIDNRSRTQAYREFIINFFVYKTPVIYVIHNYNTLNAFTKYNWLNKLMYKNKQMVAVSNEAKEKFKNKFKIKRIETIYNSLDIEDLNEQANEKLDLSNDKYILYYGRIDDYHKNLKFIITCFKHSSLPNNGFKLLLLGNGKDLALIKKFTEQLSLNEHVVFKTFINNPFPYVKQAYFTVLGSRFEGFPMVILESLALGTPVVSVDCKSGPKEIVIDKINGILVENNNRAAFIEAMDEFVLNETLYSECKKNAKQSIEKFSTSNIVKNWVSLIETLD